MASAIVVLVLVAFAVALGVLNRRRKHMPEEPNKLATAQAMIDQDIAELTEKRSLAAWIDYLHDCVAGAALIHDAWKSHLGDEERGRESVDKCIEACETVSTRLRAEWVAGRLS